MPACCINNIKADVTHFFMISASKIYGSSDCVEVMWIGIGNDEHMLCIPL